MFPLCVVEWNKFYSYFFYLWSKTGIHVKWNELNFGMNNSACGTASNDEGQDLQCYILFMMLVS